MAQKPVACSDCKPAIEITADNWPCMKRWVDDSASAATDPFKFPVYPKGQCAKHLSFKPFDFEASELAQASPSWVSLRVSEAQCLSGLGPDIAKRLSGSEKIVVSLSETGCKIRG